MNTKFLAVLVVIGHLFSNLNAAATESGFDPVTQDIPTIDPNFPPTTHEVFIPIGKHKMTGFILNANGEGPHPTFVLMHGLPGNEKKDRKSVV